MTFEDDYAELDLPEGPRRVTLRTVGLTWPPPERICFDGRRARVARTDDDPAAVLHRLSYSSITDDQRTRLTLVARGAAYAPKVTA